MPRPAGEGEYQGGGGLGFRGFHPRLLNLLPFGERRHGRSPKCKEGMGGMAQDWGRASGSSLLWPHAQNGTLRVAL